jgi:hypothetical protein
MPEPYVHIELDKPRKLRLQHNDIADIEVLTGKGFDALTEQQGFHAARILLAFGLRWKDPAINPKKAGDLIQNHWLAKGRTLLDLTEVFRSALRASGIIGGDAEPQSPADAIADESESEDGESAGNASPDPA